jgi:hypothetical protein
VVEATSGAEWLQVFKVVILPAGDNFDRLLEETILITFLMRSFVSMGGKWICLERVERGENVDEFAIF